MTPLHLEILLHFHCSGDDWNYLTATHTDYRHDLGQWGLIAGCDRPKNWTTTDKGKFYVEAILNLPLPVAKWVIPQENDK